MLDQSSLAQLSQLKTAIIASKEYGEGTVVGSKGNYGFVRLDDGRDAFLNTEKMQRVLPGDRVKVLLTKNEKDQLEAQLEALLSTGLKRFVAEYKTKDHLHFVLPQIDHFSRWIFVPPQFRGKCQAGDYVLCELTSHPYGDGKAAAKVVARLGQPSDAYIEHKIVIAKHGLYRYWHKDALAQMEACANDAAALLGREDFTSIPFVTIDGATTQDMDDAVFCQTNAEGYLLQVAIADPASFISPTSPIAKAARENAQTVYLPGETLSMLPERLSTYSFSLVEQQVRPALIVSIELDADARVRAFRFTQGKIQSRHKLTYTQVAAFINGQEALPIDPECQNSLNTLSALARARLALRQSEHWIPDDHQDYSFMLNAQGKIDRIERRERTCAHRMIEEAMLLANGCAGAFLAEHKAGLHAVHGGFKTERLGEIKALLKEELGELPAGDWTQLPDYLRLLKSLQNDSKTQLVLPPLKRMMRASELSLTAGAHMGLGFAHYATITSPIRRYADLYNHWAIVQILNNQTPFPINPKLVEQLQETLTRGRQAVRELELNLACQYLSEHIGLEDQAYIRIITQQGFGVKLQASGLEGFVNFDKNQPKTFDAKRMTLTVGERCFRLDDVVSVRVTEVDRSKNRVKMVLV
jgi:exoribonuclease II